jgi:hypothetical protein
MWGWPRSVCILHGCHAFCAIASFPCDVRQCVCTQSLLAPDTMQPFHPQVHPSLISKPSTETRLPTGCSKSSVSTSLIPSTCAFSSLLWFFQLSLCFVRMCRRRYPFGIPVRHVMQIAIRNSRLYLMYASIVLATKSLSQG